MDGVCIVIKEKDLEETIAKLDDSFYYKFLFDTSNIEDYLEDLRIKLLQDTPIFDGITTHLSTIKNKTVGTEMEKATEKAMDMVYDDGRTLAISRDYVDHPKLILVLTDTYKATSARNANITLGSKVYDSFVESFKNMMNLREGMNITSIDIYKSMKRDETGYQRFLDTQKGLVRRDQVKFKEQLLAHFNETFRFRLVTIYAKLMQFGLDDIMKQLTNKWDFGDKFNDCYLYEEEARRLLAKRLCTLSFKEDIKVLIKHGIIEADAIKYDIGL